MLNTDYNFKQTLENRELAENEQFLTDQVILSVKSIFLSHYFKNFTFIALFNSDVVCPTMPWRTKHFYFVLSFLCWAPSFMFRDYELKTMFQKQWIFASHIESIK